MPGGALQVRADRNAGKESGKGAGIAEFFTCAAAARI
jgi:hypothetical protein